MSDPRLAPRSDDPAGIWENGRRYHNFRAGLYPFPNDEPEQERLDIYHKICSVARNEVLHEAPLRTVQDDRKLDIRDRLNVHWPETPRIFDLGTGTGIWALDMAKTYPQYEVLAVDVSLIQPTMLYPNVHLYQADFEAPWAIGQNSCDLIYLRYGCGSVSNWGYLFRQVFQHLKPGFGFFEYVDIDLTPRCDDGTMRQDNPILRWYHEMRTASAAMGKPIQYWDRVRADLQQQGFVDIQEQVIRMPITTWGKDQAEMLLGRWMNLGLQEGIYGQSLALLTRYNKWTPEQVQRLTEDVKEASTDRSQHIYQNMHIWIARKP